MKLKILLYFFLIGQVTFAQTGNRIDVPGTKCSLIPPKGFTPAANYSGFENAETGASIMINEFPARYLDVVNGFTASALKTKGMTLIDKQIIDFNNSKATLINVTQPANGTIYMKQLLVFGDEQTTVMVNGIYPETSKNLESSIREALLSTVYNDSKTTDPLDAATFTIDIKDTDFKLIKYMSGSLVYSTDGKIPTEKPTLIVGNSVAKISTRNLKQYAEERLKKLPNGAFSVIKECNEITIDNMDGYEITAEGKTKNDKAELVYQVMLFNDKGDYYLILGQAKEAFEKNLSAYKKIAKTFKRKQ